MSKATDQPRSCDAPSSDDLLHRFTNVETVFQNRVAAKPNGTVFHRLALDASADQPAPACHAQPSATDWRADDPETVRRSGLTPCRSCYEAIFEYLARQLDSPVEMRSNPVSAREFGSDHGDDDLFEPFEFPSISSLSVLTQEVLVRGGCSKVMHAPTSDGALCGQTGDYRRVEPEVVAGHYRPCKDCFTVKTD